MQNPFSYDPPLALKLVTAPTGNVAVDPETHIIPNNGYSEVFSANGCLEFFLEFVFGAPATGDVIIQKVATATAAADGDTFDTYTVTARQTDNWNAGEALLGFFRVKNTSGQTLKVYLQKRIN